MAEQTRAYLKSVTQDGLVLNEAKMIDILDSYYNITDDPIDATRLSADANINVPLATSFTTIQTSIDAIPKNLGGYDLYINWATGSHSSDDDLDFQSFYNGRIIFRAATELSASGINQNAGITLNGTNQISVSGSAIFIVSSIEFITLAGSNQAIPFVCVGNMVIVSRFNHYNFAGSTIAVNYAFYVTSCRLSSDGDTLSKGTLDASFARFSGLISESNGDLLEIRNSVLSGTAFTNAAYGPGAVYAGVSNTGYTTLNANGAIDLLSADTSLFAARHNTIVAVATTTYTFLLTDDDRYVRASNASAQTLTVPPNSSVAFPIGTKLTVRQVGVGQVTFAQGSGVTINTAETLLLRAQHSTGTLIKVGTDEWDLMGDLETV